MAEQSKKKILLVGDMPGWAFHNIIQFVHQELGNRYNIFFDFCIYNPNLNASVRSDLKKTEGNQANTIQYKKKLQVLQVPVLRSIGYRFLRFANRKDWISFDEEGKFRRVDTNNQYDVVIFLDYYMNQTADFSHVKAKKVVKGIFTDGFPPKGIHLDEKNITPEIFCQKYLNDADTLIVGAPSIKTIYSPFLPSVHFVNMAYDEKIFSPKTRQKTQKDTLILGWTGNPNREFKGYHDIIVPALERLKHEGYKVELKTQFSGSLNSLADFWQQIDLALIASEADAGPSLFMEASLCGVPSISTRIGMPSLIIQDGVNGLFCERSVSDMAEKIKLLHHSSEKLNKMKARIRQDYIGVLGIEQQRKNWTKLFSELTDER